MNSLPNESQTGSAQGQTASQLHLTEKTPYLTSQWQTKGQSLSCLSDAENISKLYHKYSPDQPQYIKSLVSKDFNPTILKELRESGISEEVIFLNGKNDFCPLVGEAAFSAFLNGLLNKAYGDFDPDTPKHLWGISTDKEGARTFYRFPFTDNPLGERTRLKVKDKPLSRETVGSLVSLYSTLRWLSEKEGNGITFIPSAPSYAPVAERFNGSRLLWVEFDQIESLESQWQIIELLRKHGLDPTAVVYSGGKSLHVFYLLDESVNADSLRYLNGLFVPLGCDQAPAKNVVNQMRLPGFYRAEKGKEQTLEYLSENEYSVASFIQGIESLYLEKSFEFETLEQSQERVKVEKERLESQKINLSDYDQSDIKKAIEELIDNESIPKYVSGNNTYKTRLNCAIALVRLGFSKEEAYSLSPNLFEGTTIGWDTLEHYTFNNPIGALVSQLRQLLGDNEIKFPQWFNEKYNKGDSNQKEFNLEQWKKEQLAKYKSLKTFTPNITLQDRISNYSPIQLRDILLENDVKLSGDRVLDGIVLNILAPTGAGKTQLLIALSMEFYGTTGVALLGARNALLKQTCERSNGAIIHIHYDKKEFNDLNNSMWFAACVDSILKVDIEWWEGKIIVLDEVVSVLNHLLNSTTLKDKRAEVIERFIYALKVAKGIICLDGHNADYIKSFLEGVTDKPVINLLNDYAIARPKINLLEGTIERQKVKKNDKSPFLKHQKETIAHTPIMICSDSKIFLKSVCEIFESLGYKGLLITSETVNLKEVKLFLGNSDNWIRENKPDFILFSPSVESGVSVDISDYFGAFYSFFFGILGTDAQRQMIIRLRDINCPRYVWLRSHSIITDSTFKRKYSASEILSYVVSEVNGLHLENSAEIIANLKEKIDNFPAPVLELSSNFRFIAEYERIKFRECFNDSVKNDGYELERFTLETDKESKEILKAKTNAIKDRESAEIYNASDKFLYSIALMLGENATEGDRRAFDKAKILTALPYLEYESIWSPEFVRFIKFDRINALSARRRYIMANNLELAGKLGSKRYQDYTQKEGLCPWELKNEYLQAKAIAQSGILDLIALPTAMALTADHPMVKEIIQKCKKAAVYKGLGRAPGKDSMKFIRWLIECLGYRLKEHNFKLPDGTKRREYFIDLNDMTKTQPYFEVIDRLLTARFERSVLPQKSSTIPENVIENEKFDFGTTDPSQTVTVSSFESVPDYPIKITKIDNHLELVPPPIKTTQGTTKESFDSPPPTVSVISNRYRVGEIIEDRITGGWYIVTGVIGDRYECSNNGEWTSIPFSDVTQPNSSETVAA